jgi:hypothetical protein
LAILVFAKGRDLRIKLRVVIGYLSGVYLAVFDLESPAKGDLRGVNWSGRRAGGKGLR